MGPWITTVGGTFKGMTDDDPEVAADFSSGGFLNYFQRPDYQHDAVAPFFQRLGYQYHGLYKCVRRRGPIRLVPTLKYVQRIQPRLPGHLRAGGRLRIHPQR
jgi:tripeptidyl-peptidase-1